MQFVEGTFEFVPHERPRRVTVDQPAQNVLLEALARWDELQLWEAELPSEETRLYVVPNVNGVPASETAEWRVLALVNGRRTIRKIAEILSDEYEVKKSLISLMHKGLVSACPPAEPWLELVPAVRPASAVGGERPIPPRLRTNLLLKNHRR